MKKKIITGVIFAAVLAAITGLYILTMQGNETKKTDTAIKSGSTGEAEPSVQEASSAQAGTSATSRAVDPVSYEDTVSYDTLFNNGKLHQFKIVMSKEEWDGLSQDMLDYQSIDNSMRTGNYRKADLYYTDENGEVMLGEVGIRTKGNTSRVLPEDGNGLHRFHFKLKFNETFDRKEGTPEFEAMDKRTFAGMSELNFKVNDGSDPGYIREVFCYDLINNFGVMTSKSSLAELTFVIDGEEHDYGIVRIVEPIDKGFLTKRIGKDLNDGNLYKCLWQNYGPASLIPIKRSEEVGIKDWTVNYRPTYDLKTNKKDKNFQDILDFIDNLNKLDGDDLKAYLDKHFEVDRFLRCQALDVLLGNIDGYWSMGNNYYLYFNENGKTEWIPYDYENVLGAGWNGDPYWSYEGIATADIYKWNNLNAYMYDKNVTHPMMDKLLDIGEYKKTYEKYLGKLIDPANNYFTYSRYTDLYNQLFQLYGSKVGNEMHEGDSWSLGNEEWYFNTKIESVNQQLNQSND